MSNSPVSSDGTMGSTLIEVLCQRAAQQPERRGFTFLLDGEMEEAHLTYLDLHRQAQSLGAKLQSLGATGKRVLLLYPPGLEYIAAFFGCLYAGAVAVPAYPPDPTRLNRTLPRLQAVVADARATIALTTSMILGMAEFIFEQAPDLQALQWLATDEIANRPEEWRDPAVGGDTLAYLQYTSGSTNTPRGVMLTHRNLLHNCLLIHECFGHTPESQGVIWLPPYHDMGLIGGILQPLYGGFPVTLMSPIDFLKRPLSWLQAVSRYKGTTSGGPNFAYDLCVRKITPDERATLDLSSWSVAFNGSEPVRHETLQRFTQTFAPCGFHPEAFYPCYGLAEATLIVTGGLTAAPPVTLSVSSTALRHHRVQAVPSTDPEARTLVSCGRELSNQRVVIANPETRLPCPPEEVGEIWVSGPSVAQGYWNQPEATAQTFGAYFADSGQGPFLSSGDLGFLREQELYIVGRIKDLIIIRGRNHHPADIERTAEKSHPALRPGCCAAFPIPVAGEERLVLVQEVGRQAADTDEVMRAIRQAVAEEHELQVYALWLLEPGSIPKTSSGKIQRYACRDAFLADSLETVAKSVLEVEPDEIVSTFPLSATSIQKALADTDEPSARQALLTLFLQDQVARILQVPPSRVSTKQPITALGLDSLMAAALQHQLETSLDVDLTTAGLLEAPSLAQLATNVLAERSDWNHHEHE